jgi:hypothetical protein
MLFGGQGVILSEHTTQLFDHPAHKFRKIELLRGEVPENDALFVETRWSS